MSTLGAGGAGVPRAGNGNGYSAVALVGLALAVFSPVALAVAVLVMFAVLSQHRWHWWAPALVAGGVTVAMFGAVQVITGSALGFHFSGYVAWLHGEHPSLAWLLMPTLPLGLPVGALAGACWVGLQQAWTGRAEFHPLEVRRRMIDQQASGRRLAQRLDDPAALAQCSAPPLGVVIDGDLASFIQGPYAVVPPGQHLAVGVVGASGAGKTVTLQRLVGIWAEAGRKVVFADFKGTDPELPERIIAAYRSVRPDARCCLWPAQSLDMWRGAPHEVASRLLQVQDFTEPYYKQIASAAVRRALSAPDIDGTGPVQNSATFMARLNADWLRRAWAGVPGAAEDIASLTRKPDLLDGVRLRYGEFFSALAGRFDFGFSYEDADLVVLIVPTLAEREDAMAAARMLLSDYGHYCIRRKARRGEDSVFILDEFSAVTAAAPMVIDLAERVRDVGGQVVVSTQGYQGLGTTDDERKRMVEALAGGFILHACADPDELVKVAGTVRGVQQSWQLDSLGGSGMGSAKMHHKLRIDPDAVRQARTGEAWIIASGHALHVLVRPPDIDPGQRRAAHDLITSATAQTRSAFADPPAPQTRPRPRPEAPRPDDHPWWGDP